jgi:hypothetical protein
MPGPSSVGFSWVQVFANRCSPYAPMRPDAVTDLRRPSAVPAQASGIDRAGRRFVVPPGAGDQQLGGDGIRVEFRTQPFGQAVSYR